MKRTAVALVLTAALGGCMSVNSGPEMSGPVCRGNCGPVAGPQTIPGAVGPWGGGVPVLPPYSAPMNARYAQYMMGQSIPINMAQQTLAGRSGADPGVMQASANIPQGPGMPPLPVPPGGMLTPPGMPGLPGLPGGPGMMPGRGPMPPGGPMMAASGPIPPPGAMPLGPPPRFTVARTQVRFARPSGMKIAWFNCGPDGQRTYSATPIETPGRYNFLQAAIYRLKLSNIEGRAGLELYPTLEVVPTNPKTEAFLAHNAVPVEFTADDFQQVVEGNYLVKVIYLPDPAYQELAATGTDEIVSTRLEPGADPIKEALRRGSILLVIRMGNMDQEAPNTPAIDAPGPNKGMPMFPPPGMPMMPPGMMGPGMHGPGPMIPYTNPFMGPHGAMGPGGPAMGPGGPPMGPGGPGMGGPMPYQLPTGAPYPPPGYPTGMPYPPPGYPTGLPYPPPGMPPGMPMPPARGMPSAPAAPPTGAAAPARAPEGGGVRPAGASSLPVPGQPLLRTDLPTPAAAAQPSVGALPTPTAAALAIQDGGKK